MLATLLLIQSAAGMAGQVASDKPVVLASLPSPDMPSLKEAIKDCLRASGNRKTVATILQQLGWLPAELNTWSPFSAQPGKVFTRGTGSAAIYLDRSGVNSPPCTVTGVLDKAQVLSLVSTIAEAVSAKSNDMLLGTMMFPGHGSLTGLKVQTAGSLLNYRVSVLFVNQEQQ